MPYDQMGSGFGQWSRGGGIPGLRSIYGYGDQGAMYSPQQKQPPNPSQTMNALAPNQGMTQITPQGDFFTQLAGLFGAGSQMGAPSAQPRRYGDSPYQNVAAGQASIDYAKTLPPAQYWDYLNRNAGRNQQAFGMEKARERGAIAQQEAMTRGRVGQSMQPRNPQASQPYSMGGSVYSNDPSKFGQLESRNPGSSSFLPGDDSPNRPVPGQGMPKPGRPMRAPDSNPVAQRAPGLMASNSPTLGEKNPLNNMPSNRRMPARSSGRASMGRAAPRMPSRANFNYQMGGNG